MAEKSADCYLSYFLPARVTLGVMGFLMFLVTQMIRVNLYIAIVPINEDFHGNATSSEAAQWNENASGLLLSAFYWSYWITELPGGFLSQTFGGRKVLGIGVTLAGLLNFILPLTLDAHYMFAAAVRALQGIALGVTWPAMHWLSARWIPKAERSKFMTVYHGAAIGTAITYPLSGVIIENFGWRYVFYWTGGITIAWSCAWWLFVYDSPYSHPRITNDEKNYLEEEIGDSITSQKGKIIATPWKEILHSKPFWGVLFASQGLMWGTITLSMQTPLYFRNMHDLDIKTIGLFSGIPEVCKFAFGLIFSSIIDKAIHSKLLTITAARKLAVAVCEYLPALFLVILGVYGAKNANLALILLICVYAVGGASSSGSLANIVDLSPNHAGTLLGLIKTLTIVPGVVSPLIATFFTRPHADPETGWSNVMYLTAFVYFLCCSVFQICGSGKESIFIAYAVSVSMSVFLLFQMQHWNTSSKNDGIIEAEMRPLQNNSLAGGDARGNKD